MSGGVDVGVGVDACRVLCKSNRNIGVGSLGRFSGSYRASSCF